MPDNKEELKKKLRVAIEKTVVAISAAPGREYGAILEKLVSYTRRLAVCVDCGAPLDPRLRDRCPKHAGIDATKTFIANKAKKHGPTIVMNVMSKAAEALDKILGDPNAPAPEEEQS